MIFTKVTLKALIASILMGCCSAQRHIHKRQTQVATQVNLVTVDTYQTTTVYVDSDDGVQQKNVQTDFATMSEKSSALTSQTSAFTTQTSAISYSPTSTKQTTTLSPSPSPSSYSISSSSSTSASSHSSETDTVGSGESKGITYSPYSTSGCKSLDQVKSDFKQLAQFDVIRLYATDCSQLEYALQAKSDSQKILAGIFDMSKIESSANDIANAVSNHGSWDDIYAVTVGNELVNGGTATASQMKSYVEKAKNILKSKGFTGKVTTVDTQNAVLSNKDLCSAGDFIAVNAHAYFSTETSADKAGEWVRKQIENIASYCSVDESSILVTESGWPSSGDTNGKAIPSPENQKTAIASIKEKAGSQTLLFTAFNDYWKAKGYLNVEQSFGILS